MNIQVLDLPSQIDRLKSAADHAPVVRRTSSLGEAIALRLKSAQDEAGLSVRALAEQAHTSAPTIQAIRNGRGGRSEAGLLADIAKALNVAPAWLVYGTGPRTEPDDDLEAIRSAFKALPKRDRTKLLAELANDKKL